MSHTWTTEDEMLALRYRMLCMSLDSLAGQRQALNAEAEEVLKIARRRGLLTAIVDIKRFAGIGEGK